MFCYQFFFSVGFGRANFIVKRKGKERPKLGAPLKGLAHESSLGEADPPFGGFVRLRVKDFVAKAKSRLLAQLGKVTSHSLLLPRVSRLGVHGIERKSSFSRKLKSSDSKRVHLFQTLIFGVASVELLEALDDVKREINEDAISLALDLVVTEEDVGFEVHQSLVYDVHVIVSQ